MDTLNKTWPLQPNAMLIAFRSSLITNTGFHSILGWWGLKSKTLHVTPFLFFVIGSYIITSLLLLRRYLLAKQQPQAIVLREGVLTVPRLLFPIQIIHLGQIRSIERYQRSGETVAALIGRFNDSSVFIEKRVLKREADFENLFSCLFQSVSFDKKLQNENQGCAAGKEIKKMVYANAVFPIFFLLIYLLTAANYFSSITDTAVSQGGLTKSSLTLVNLYRFSSSFFLHASPIHLLVNIIALVSVGQGLMAICGRAWFSHLFLCAAAFGSLISVMLSSYTFVIGASGGILGLYGAYFVLCAKYQKKFPASVLISTRSILIILAVQLTLDLILSDVDIFSHIGGFTYGFLTTAFLLHNRSLEKIKQWAWHYLLAAGCGVTYLIGLAHFFSIYFVLKF